MKVAEKRVLSPFLKDKAAVKRTAVAAIRNSFEIEGIYFNDIQMARLIEKARSGNSKAFAK
ncbi:MAG: hypothetical protein IBJ09_08995 [Bacteroidia bacterium]|nr:hypothetical protein [Bacteroidia bacterium]